ncbi:DsbA family protein [Vreelandella massiliensis]|uniref:DsbA family protein n=1 Tax=Vreelandella massiliensis TaxID=1816686 RepID=UPI00096A7A29|nr:thioredoxin domain-containing protein [Halomonas massiliensis]
MARKNVNQNTGRNTPYLALGGVIGSGLLATFAFGLVVNAQLQTNDHLNETNQKLSALASAIESSNQNGQADEQELVAAIDMVMDKREQAEREAQQQALLADFDNAPKDIPETGKWTYGDVDARFTLYTYSDPNCPYCRQFHGTPKQLVDSSDGVLNTQYHHMTIMDANSTTQALASECAGRLGDNQVFWAMNDFIYENHQVRKNGLLDVAETLGFDQDQFESCMNDSEVNRHVAKRAQQAKDKDVTGTPTSFLIDNKTGDSVRLAGAQPPGAIISALRDMLQERTASEASSTAEAQEG